MPSKAFKLAEAMVSNPVMSDMVENPTATPTQIAAVETKTSAISDTGVISVNTKNIVSNNVLTQSFDSNQVVGFNLTDSINAVSPIVSVFKEVPQAGFSSKGRWDVNANATNYDFYDEKPYSTYASLTLTPSATGDGTFTSSNPTVVGYQMSSTVNLNSTSPSITAQGSGGSWQVVEFDPTGNHVYMVSNTTQVGYAKTVYQYTMSTPHDLSTLNTTPANTLDMSSRVSGTIAHYCPLHITNSGYDLYFGDYQNNIIYQWKMSTAYDLSTASYHGASSAIFVNTMVGLFIQPDGLTGYQVQDGIVGSAVLREFTMSTAWDITTASLTGTTSATLISRTQAVTISPDGTLVIASDAFGSTTSKYFTMSPGYDLSSLSSGTSFTWQGNSSHTTDTRFSSDGALLYGYTGTYIYNYTTGSTAAFSAADVGKKVVGNSGSAIITSTAGAYTSVTAFADTSAISSWQLFGAEGKSDGSGIQLSGFEINDTYNLSSPSYVGEYLWNNTAAYPTEIGFSTDGTKCFYLRNSNDSVYHATLSTPFDISTLNNVLTYSVTGNNSNPRGIWVKEDGMSFMVVGTSSDRVFQWNLSSAWDLSSGVSVVSTSLYVGNQASSPNSMDFNSDGTKLYVIDYSGNIYQYGLTAGFNISTASYDSVTSGQLSTTDCMGMRFNSDGTKIFIQRAAGPVETYNLSPAYDITSATLDSGATWTTGLTGVWGISFSPSGHYVYLGDNSNTSYPRFKQYTSGTGVSYTYSYSQYFPALTNSSNGQINSSSWQDINSMTADETKNGGDIFYAVSTDNRTSWDVAKGSDGVRKIAKNNSGTWQYNNDAGSLEGFDYTNATTTGDTLTVDVSNVGIAGGSNQGIIFSGDGTKFYLVYQATSSNSRIYQVTLGTAWDLTSGTTKYTFNPSVTQISAGSIGFNQNGTALYIAWRAHPGTARYFKKFTLSTAWDLSTASGGVNSANLNSSGDFETCRGLTVGLNEEFIVTTDYAASDDHLAKFTFATAGDVTSSITKSESTNVTSYTNFPPVGSGNTRLSIAGPQFFDNGNKLFFMNYNYGGDAYIVNLTSAYDITSGTLGSTTGDISGAGTWMAYGVKPDGTRLYIFDHNSSSLIEYSTGNINYDTSETWVNGTNNNEHATLQEALGAQSFNRMNKAQLDAVADGYHFSQDSADTLDLMIAPYAASGSSPISDGVTINYDAEAIVREAIPGTDYIADFPNNTTINIKSLVNTNMKVRAL